MTSEQVLETLHTYRDNLGRSAHLKVEIDETQAVLDELRRTAREDMAAPGAQNLDGMPRGTAVSSPTERIAMLFAAGGEPSYIAQMQEELSLIQAEHHAKSIAVALVDAWLSGLTDRERWVVSAQVIDGMTWRELAKEHERLYGETRTKEALKRLKAKAMEKIFRMAA